MLEAGNLGLRITPIATGFWKETEAKLRAGRQAKAEVNVEANLKKASAEIAVFRAQQQARNVKLRLTIDEKSLRRANEQVRHIEHTWKASNISRSIRVQVFVAGATLLPAVTQGVLSLTAAITDLGRAAFALPGLLAGVGAAAGTLATGMRGVGKAFGEASSGIEDAERASINFSRASRDLERAQKGVVQALKQANREIQDQKDSLAQGQLSVEQAQLNVARANQEVARGGFRNFLDYKEALLGVKQANLDLSLAVKQNSRNVADYYDNATRSVTQTDVFRDSLDNLKDSLADFRKAQFEAAGMSEEFISSMKKLAPAGQDFVIQLLRLKGAWTGLQRAVQQNLFQGLGDAITDLANRRLPLLQKGMSNVAASINSNFKTLIKTIGSDANASAISKIFDRTATAIRAANPGLEAFTNGLLHLSEVGARFLPRMAFAFNRVMERFDAFVERTDKDGSLKRWIDQGLQLFASLGRSIIHIGSILNSLTDAYQKATGNVGGFATTLEKSLGGLARRLSSPAGQNKLIAYVREAREFLSVIQDALPGITKLIGMVGDAARSFAEDFFPLLSLLGDALEGHARLVVAILKAYVALRVIKPLLVGIGKGWRGLTTSFKGYQASTVVGIERLNAAVKAHRDALDTQWHARKQMFDNRQVLQQSNQDWEQARARRHLARVELQRVEADVAKSRSAASKANKAQKSALIVPGVDVAAQAKANSQIVGSYEKAKKRKTAALKAFNDAEQNYLRATQARVVNQSVAHGAMAKSYGNLRLATENVAMAEANLSREASKATRAGGWIGRMRLAIGSGKGFGLVGALGGLASAFGKVVTGIGSVGLTGGAIFAFDQLTAAQDRNRASVDNLNASQEALANTLSKATGSATAATLEENANQLRNRPNPVHPDDRGQDFDAAKILNQQLGIELPEAVRLSLPTQVAEREARLAPADAQIIAAVPQLDEWKKWGSRYQENGVTADIYGKALNGDKPSMAKVAAARSQIYDESATGLAGLPMGFGVKVAGDVPNDLGGAQEQLPRNNTDGGLRGLSLAAGAVRGVGDASVAAGADAQAGAAVVEQPGLNRLGQSKFGRFTLGPGGAVLNSDGTATIEVDRYPDDVFKGWIDAAAGENIEVERRFPDGAIITIGPDDAKKYFGKGYASGGSVWGAGTATSDSIPAMLSNGEFVMNARSAKAIGHETLSQLNMAGGGLARRSPDVADVPMNDFGGNEPDPWWKRVMKGMVGTSGIGDALGLPQIAGFSGGGWAGGGGKFDSLIGPAADGADVYVPRVPMVKNPQTLPEAIGLPTKAWPYETLVGPAAGGVQPLSSVTKPPSTLPGVLGLGPKPAAPKPAPILPNPFARVPPVVGGPAPVPPSPVVAAPPPRLPPAEPPATPAPVTTYGRPASPPGATGRTSEQFAWDSAVENWSAMSPSARAAAVKRGAYTANGTPTIGTPTTAAAPTEPGLVVGSSLPPVGFNEQGAQRNTIKVGRVIRALWPTLGANGNGNSWRVPDGPMEHNSGVAIDLGLGDYTDPEQIRHAQDATDYLMKNASALNVRYVLWDNKLWYPNGDVVNYGSTGGASDQHIDHLHINTTGGGYPVEGEQFVVPAGLVGGPVPIGGPLPPAPGAPPPGLPAVPLDQPGYDATKPLGVGNFPTGPGTLLPGGPGANLPDIPAGPSPTDLPVVPAGPAAATPVPAAGPLDAVKDPFLEGLKQIGIALLEGILGFFGINLDVGEILSGFGFGSADEFGPALPTGEPDTNLLSQMDTMSEYYDSIEDADAAASIRKAKEDYLKQYSGVAVDAATEDLAAYFDSIGQPEQASKLRADAAKLSAGQTQTPDGQQQTWPPKMATGGYVSGPGGPTSDSIPAMLSDGEFVMRAAAVDKIGVDRLHSMNRYADGGWVGGGGGFGTPVPGEVDTRPGWVKGASAGIAEWSKPSRWLTAAGINTDSSFLNTKAVHVPLLSDVMGAADLIGGGSGDGRMSLKDTMDMASIPDLYQAGTTLGDSNAGLGEKAAAGLSMASVVPLPGMRPLGNLAKGMDKKHRPLIEQALSVPMQSHDAAAKLATRNWPYTTGKNPFNEAQLEQLQEYTASPYLNSWLRTLDDPGFDWRNAPDAGEYFRTSDGFSYSMSSGRLHQLIAEAAEGSSLLDESMASAARVPGDGMWVTRMTDKEQLGIMDNRGIGDPRNLGGKSFRDPGYLSTSVGVADASEFSNPFGSHQPVGMRIFVPGGSKGIYLAQQSKELPRSQKTGNPMEDRALSPHVAEKELLLPRGISLTPFGWSLAERKGRADQLWLEAIAEVPDAPPPLNAFTGGNMDGIPSGVLELLQSGRFRMPGFADGGWVGGGGSFDETPVPTLSQMMEKMNWASGGHVVGSGTGTSDSIPAWLSNGEFVMNAKATKHWGVGNLMAMNGYSVGGPVMPFNLPPLAPLAPPPPPPAAPPGPAPPPAPSAPSGSSDPDAFKDTAAPASAESGSADPDAFKDLTAIGTAALSPKGGGVGGGASARPSNAKDPRAIMGRAPTSEQHLNPALSAGIKGAFNTAGAIAGTAAALGMSGLSGGAASPAAGAASTAIAAGAAMAGEVASGAANVIASLLVGTVTPAETGQGYGAPLLPQPQQRAVSNFQSVHNGNIVTNNLEEYNRLKDRKDAQKSIPFFNRVPE